MAESAPRSLYGLVDMGRSVTPSRSVSLRLPGAEGDAELIFAILIYGTVGGGERKPSTCCDSQFSTIHLDENHHIPPDPLLSLRARV